MSNPYQTPDPNQGDPYSAPAPQNPYGTPAPQDPYGAPAAPQDAYGTPAPQDPYGGTPAPQDPYATPAPQDPYGAPAAPQDPYAATPYGSPASADPYASQGYSPSGYNTAPYDTPAPSADPYGAPQAPAYASYGQQPYAQGGMVPAYAGILPDHPQAVVVLILGIVSVIILPIAGPFAWFFGNRARKEIQARPGTYKQGGILTVGWVLGIIGTVFLMFSILWLILVVGLAATS